MTPSLVRMRQLTYAAILCLTTAAWAQREQPESPIDAALRDLSSQETRERGLVELLAQSGIQVGSPGSRMGNLLRTHPQQAERIRTTLIAWLEKQGEDYVRLVQAGQSLSNVDPESWMFLTDAVAGLRDPRAVKGLVLALGVGSIEGLADICPSAVDAIIERIHQPDLDVGGIASGDRRQAVTTLGWCLQRPAMMRANPGVLAKIRRELLADLSNPDSSIRGHAAEALSALRTDPEVRAKLQADPYLASEFRALSSDAFSFYVTRSTEARVCRIQQASEAPVEEQFIGPDSKDALKPLMCRRYDPTHQDPSLCWHVVPANVCSQ
jgi:hypothetical protein